MRRFAACFFALLLIFALFSCAMASNEITVQGSGTVSVTPDVAIIRLGVQKTGEDISSIQSEANSVISAVRAALVDEIGIDEKDISTNGYSIYRDYSRYYESDDPVYYTAYPTLRIVARDISQAGAIIDKAFACGCNALEDIAFDVEDRSAHDDAALALAVKDGIHRAQVVAEAAGLTLPDAPSSITEGTITGYQTNWRSSNIKAAASVEDAAGAPTEVMGGALSVTATVTVTYTIE